MRTLIHFIIILLASATCSCTASRQSCSTSSDSTALQASSSRHTHIDEETLSLLNSSRHLDLSGITVEFFPPLLPLTPTDSATSSPRPVPRSITINRAQSTRTSGSAVHHTISAVGNDTVNVRLDESSATSQTSASGTSLLSPSRWIILSSLLAAILLLSVILIIRIRSPT